MFTNNKLEFKCALFVAFSLSISACNDSGTYEQGSSFNAGANTQDSSDNGFDQSALLESLQTQFFTARLQAFEQQLDDLKTNTQAYCEALTSNSDQAEATRTQAQSAWRASMSQWQQVEMMQLGPLLANDGSLRNQIYSWPERTGCGVDQDVGHFQSGEFNGAPYDVETRTSDRRGLDALEYLLFNDDLDHSCSKDSWAPDGWNQRSEHDRKTARCQFAVELVRDVKMSAATLTEAWGDSDTGFAKELLSAGTSDSQFESAHKAINAITDALFYIDSITKDRKLGAPSGLIANTCGSATCVEDIESALSHNAIANVHANLLALQAIFLGSATDSAALGFDDYLRAVDAEDLANTMATDIQAAIDAVSAFSGTMTDAVNTNPAKVHALYQAVKKVTDNLKSIFITQLSLELPITSAGDAD